MKISFSVFFLFFLLFVSFFFFENEGINDSFFSNKDSIQKKLAFLTKNNATSSTLKNSSQEISIKEEINKGFSLEDKKEEDYNNYKRFIFSSQNNFNGPFSKGEKDFKDKIVEEKEKLESALDDIVKKANSNNLVYGTSLKNSSFSLPIGVKGKKYSYVLENIVNSSSLYYVLYKGKLPDGLKLYSTSALLSGIPKVSGVFDFSVLSVREDKRAFLQKYTLTVKEEDSLKKNSLKIETLALPSITVGKEYNFQIQVSGGTKPYFFNISGLPDSFKYDSRVGVISGVSKLALSCDLLVEVIDSENNKREKSFNLQINSSSLSITTSSILEGVVGSRYSFLFNAEGGSIPYKWQLVSGALPSGISFNSERGEIFGVPEKESSSKLRIRVMDDDFNSDEVELELKIVNSSFKVLNKDSLICYFESECIEQFNVVGGVPPYSFDIKNGELPSGLTLKENGLLSGVVNKGVKESGSFTLRVIDFNKKEVLKTFFWTLKNKNLLIDTISLKKANLCEDYSFSIKASGGSRPYIFTLKGVSSSVNEEKDIKDKITLTEDGTLKEKELKEGLYRVLISVKDSNLEEVTKLFNLEVENSKLKFINEKKSINLKKEEEFSYPLVAEGGCLPYEYFLKDNNLEHPLTINKNFIDGKFLKEGEFSVEVGVRDSLNNEAENKFLFSVRDSFLKIEGENILEFREGESFKKSLSIKGGEGPYFLSIVKGSLPQNVILDSDFYLIQSSIVGRINSKSVTIEVRDSLDNKALKDFLIVDLDKRLRILTEDREFFNLEVSKDFNLKLEASGGSGVYFFRADDFLLKELGLSLDSSGVISGKLKKIGDFKLKVFLEDSEGEEVTKIFNLKVKPLKLEILTSILKEAKKNIEYREKIRVRGGVSPYSFKILESDFPFSLNSLTGEVSGVSNKKMPLKAFTLKVEDSKGSSSLKEIMLKVGGGLRPSPMEFQAVGSQSKVGLVWINPKNESDFLGVKVFRSDVNYPKEIGEGEIVYEGLRTNIVDRNLENGKTYYYSIRAYYKDGSYSSLEDDSLLKVTPRAIFLDENKPNPFIDAVISYNPLDPNNCFGCSRFPKIVLGYPTGSLSGMGSSDVLSLHAKVNNDNAKSAPYGGSIVLAFKDNIVTNEEGADFTIFENVFRVGADLNSFWIEPAVVDVSVDGINFYRFPFDFVPHYDSNGNLKLQDPNTYSKGFSGIKESFASKENSIDPRDPKVSGGDSFDLSDIKEENLSWIRFIRITSTGDLWLRDINGDLVRHSNESPSWGASGTGNSGFDLDAVCAIHY